MDHGAREGRVLVLEGHLLLDALHLPVGESQEVLLLLGEDGDAVVQEGLVASVIMISFEDEEDRDLFGSKGLMRELQRRLALQGRRGEPGEAEVLLGVEQLAIVLDRLRREAQAAVDGYLAMFIHLFL